MKDTVKATRKSFQRDELVKGLVRAGELLTSGENEIELDTYFEPTNYRFQGPEGFEADYAGLTDYFKSIFIMRRPTKLESAIENTIFPSGLLFLKIS